MKRSDIERAKNTLRADRLRLSEERAVIASERLALERQQVRLDRRARELEAERAATIAVLRQVCARFGDNDWADGDDLAEIIADHLADPLEAMAAAVNRRMRRLQSSLALATGPVALVAPEPLRPVTRGSSHIVRTYPDRTLSGGTGWRPACGCGWRGDVVARYQDADELIGSHLDESRTSGREDTAR